MLLTNKSSNKSTSSTSSNISSSSAKETDSNLTNGAENRTVTLKARVTDIEKMEGAIFGLMNTIGHLTKEQDVYFNVPNGQLKLRLTKNFQQQKDRGLLIASKQTNNIGPNFCESRTTQIADIERFQNTLAFSLTKSATIIKKRRVYENENIRIHLDNVENLGTFIDIEIHANTKKNIEDQLTQAILIQNELGINNSNLLPYSYLELYQDERKNLTNNICRADSGMDEEDESSTNSDVSI